MEILIIVGVILCIVIWIITVSNKLNRMVVKVDEADSGIDIALTKRFDVLTKMKDVVKGYAKHEKETIIEAIKFRKGMSINKKQEVYTQMNDAFDKLNLVVEAYPDLKASENYKALQLAIVDTEEHLQAARRFYNSVVSKFNQMIVTFPISIIAKNKSMKKKEFFEVEEAKTKDVNMEM